MSLSSEKVKIGIVGCGNISPVYFENICNYFEITELVACADLDLSRAKQKTEECDDKGELKYPGVKAVTVEELLSDPQIEIVVNLTTPQAHFEVADKALDAGKHVYSEKPLTLSREQGKALLEKGATKGLRIGNAPDTFLGEGHQTARKIIDDGWIGKPVSATAFMACPGHESWHPDPEFYYQLGGGPMFDMGPYYLTDLIFLIGSIQSVCGMTSKAFEKRTITSSPKFGKVIDVEVPTHIAGQLLFSNGAIGTIITSFDVKAHSLPCIEIYGTTGSLRVPDPNCFDGTVKIFSPGMNGWQDVPPAYRANGQRGKGVADMAGAIRNKRPHRPSGKLAYHVLDVMHSLHESCQNRKFIDIESTADRPAPLQMVLLPGKIESC